MPDGWKGVIEGRLEKRREKGWMRALDPIAPGSMGPDGAGGVRAERNFSTNDYLGLAGHPEVRAAVAEAARAWGMGPRGSALVCGHTELHAELAGALAALEGADEVLLAPTGYAANVAVLTALADEDVTFVSDALNHASIIDGLGLARRRGAGLRVVPHGDVGAFEAALGEVTTARAVIVTDTVFSMDGDVAPLAALRALADRHGALLVVDEAHGTLVLGERGRGACEVAGVHADVVVGTLSKAVGAMGGFIAGSREVCALCLNEGRPQIYSTALPVPVVAGALAALEVSRREPERRARLRAHERLFGEALGRAVETPIVPWIVGSEERAVAVAGELRSEGFHVVAIRPPTVAPGTSRLRIALSAAHAEADVRALIEAIGRVAGGPAGRA